MRKGGSGVVARQGGYGLGVAKQVSEHIHMMNAHIKNFDARVFAQKRLPVRNGVHVDIRKHRPAQQTVLQQAFQGANGGIIAHVAVYAQLYAVFRAEAHDFLRFLKVHRQRLLAKDAANMRLLHGVAHNFQLTVRRNGDIKNLHVLIQKQFLPGIIHPGNAKLLCHRVRFLALKRGDRMHTETHLPVGGKLLRPHNKPGPHHSDAEIAPPWGNGLNAQYNRRILHAHNHPLNITAAPSESLWRFTPVFSRRYSDARHST